MTEGQRSAIIIGAGPAGCSAAIHLARANWDVTLIEAKPFPRGKVCGEFISPAATTYLEALLPPDDLLRAGARQVGSFVLERGRRAITWPMPAPAWVLSRRTLDTLLVERAADAGANVLQPVVVSRSECTTDHAHVTLRDGRTLAADIVIHADGRGRFDGPSARLTPMRPGVVGLKCHLRLPSSHATSAIHIRSVRGAYVGLVAIEDGLATLAMTVRTALVQRLAQDHDALLASLWPAYDPAWRATNWLSSGIASSSYISPSHMRSFRVGNAAAAVEPVGGEGIGLALWSGATLAALLARGVELATVQHSFAALYRTRLRFRRPACRSAAFVLERPALMAMLWPALTLAPTRHVLIAPWYAMTGKGDTARRSKACAT
ncbi:MAG: NAD(P)-binding protein [Phycisphaerales bacterium]|nr:NAD(P)-binding protein [Phycisphaerales bacterium]